MLSESRIFVEMLPRENSYGKASDKKNETRIQNSGERRSKRSDGRRTNVKEWNRRKRVFESFHYLRVISMEVRYFQYHGNNTAREGRVSRKYRRKSTENVVNKLSEAGGDTNCWKGIVIIRSVSKTRNDSNVTYETERFDKREKKIHRCEFSRNIF